MISVLMVVFFFIVNALIDNRIFFVVIRCKKSLSISVIFWKDLLC